MSARLQHCRMLLSGRLYDPFQCMFTDEKWFCADTSSGKVWMTDKDDPDRFTNKKQHPIKVMFFGGVCSYGTPPLIPIEGNLTAKGYIKLLQKHYVPWIQENCPFDTVWWLQDNPTVHTTQFNLIKMACWGWKQAPHPAVSPDLNPDEFCWMDTDCLLKEYTITTKAQLIAAVQECWKIAAHPSNFKSYVNGMLANAKQVIRKGGGNHYVENKCKRMVNYAAM